MYKTTIKNKEVRGTYPELVKLINEHGLLGQKIVRI
jgi:hypothetical protein